MPGSFMPETLHQMSRSRHMAEEAELSKAARNRRHLDALACETRSCSERRTPLLQRLLRTVLPARARTEAA
jgi:hypothetical protein